MKTYTYRIYPNRGGNWRGRPWQRGDGIHQQDQDPAPRPADQTSPHQGHDLSPAKPNCQTLPIH